MAYIVRIALKKLRESEESAFDTLLRQTSGTWTSGDGLEYQQKIRDEWE